MLILVSTPPPHRSHRRLNVAVSSFVASTVAAPIVASTVALVVFVAQRDITVSARSGSTNPSVFKTLNNE